MYHDEISETLKEAIKQIGILKKQEDGFIEDCNKSSKRNAELTQKINKLTQENDELAQENNKRKTNYDSLYNELLLANKILGERAHKIKGHEHKIHQLNGMLKNGMADTDLDKKAIDELTQEINKLKDENIKLKTKNDSLYRELNQSSYKILDDRDKIEQLERANVDLIDRNDALIDENEDLSAQNDCRKKDLEELREAFDLLVERNEQLIKQVCQEEDTDCDNITKYRYSYGQNKAFMAFAIANDIPEPTLHKFYEALLKLERGFDVDETNNLFEKLESLEHLINRHILSNALTAKLNENGGE